MRILIFLILVLFEILFAYDIDRKDEIRRLFYFAVESVDSLKNFEKKLKNLNQKLDRSFLLAYNGAYLTLVAKHSFNPYTKYFKLKEGIELLEQAIQQQPDNLEFRFIRISILNYVPSLLGFDEIFFQDYEKAFELLNKKDFKLIDKQTQKGIIEFLMRSKKLSPAQKSELNKLYKEFE
jgi:tetratricopeptide (TPR) repeat protein